MTRKSSNRNRRSEQLKVNGSSSGRATARNGYGGIVPAAAATATSRSTMTTNNPTNTALPPVRNRNRSPTADDKNTVPITGTALVATATTTTTTATTVTTNNMSYTHTNNSYNNQYQNDKGRYPGYALGFCTKLQPEAPLNSDERLWEIQVMNESIRLMKQEEERQILAAIEASRKMMTDTAAGVGDHSNAAAPDDDVRSTIREEERQLLAALDDDEGIEKRNDLMEIQAVNDSLRTMMREEEQQLISALEASRLESTGWCNNGGDIVFPDAKKSSRMDDGRVNFPAAKLEDHDDEKAIISIQTAWRVVIAKNKVREEKKARFFNMHRHFGKKRRKKAATRVQAFVRGSLQRRKYMQARLLRSSNHHQEMMMMMMKTTCHQDDDSMSHHHPYPDKMVKISVPQSSNENEPEDTQRSGSLEATPDSLQSSSSVVTTVSCYDELFFLDGNGDSDRTSDDEVILDQEGSHSCDDDDGENDSDSSSLNLKDDDDFVHVTNTTTSSSSDCDDSFCLIDVDCNFDDNDDKNISDNYNH